MRISIEDLNALVRVAEFGSFSAAANALGITQSALSRRIKKLEDTLQVRVFDRTTRKVSLSAMGREFLPEAIRVLEDYERSISDMNDFVQIRAGLLRVATNRTIAELYLPKVVKSFREKHPQIRIRIVETTTPGGLQQLHENKLELALIEYSGEDPDFEFVPMIEDHFAAVCHPDHPFARRQSIDWTELRDASIIKINSSSPTWKPLIEMVGEPWTNARSILELGQIYTALACVSENLGVVVLPHLVNELRANLGLVSVPLTNPLITRTLGAVTRKGRSLSPAAAAFLDMCTETMRLSAPPQSQLMP